MMKRKEKYIKLIGQLKSVNYQGPDEKNIVSILLFRNYLTELFSLKRKLGNDSDYIKSSDAHNIFLDINPSWFPEIKDLNSFIEDLKKNNINIPTGRYWNSLFVYLFIYWEVYKDTEDLNKFGVDNPYLSTIKILERVQHIYVYGGQIEIGNFTFKNSDKYRGYKLPSLDDEFLNYLEENCSEIPNQEKTNQLWLFFQELK